MTTAEYINGLLDNGERERIDSLDDLNLKAGDLVRTGGTSEHGDKIHWLPWRIVLGEADPIAAGMTHAFMTDHHRYNEPIVSSFDAVFENGLLTEVIRGPSDNIFREDT